MHKPTIFLTLLFALGMYSVVPAVTKFGPLAAAAAHAESDSESGGAVYGGWLLLFGRAAVAELIALVRRR